MILIDKQTRGRFGNKVFHYNTLVQLSNIVNQDFICAVWEGSSLFSEIQESNTWHRGKPLPAKEIPPFDLINLTESELKKQYSLGDFKLHSLSLAGPFFRITKKDPREFLKFEKPVDFPEAEVVVGIHIRGGDTRGADGLFCREIHPPKYYIDAIKFVVDQYPDIAGTPKLLFCLCTDDPDPKFPSFNATFEYLKQSNLEVYMDTTNTYQKDFIILAHSDILIAGSSTFVLAAGMTGKHKKIIHSKEFIEPFKDEEQKWYSSFGNGMFFHDMNHMKSDYYNVWKLI